MSKFTDIKKVIIIGGGPAALLAALRLKRNNGITCILYEIRSKPSTLGGAIGIPANGLRLLNSLGLYDELAAKGAFTSKITLHALNGCVMGEMDIAAWSKRHTGFGYLRIQRTDLMEVLLQAAERENIVINYGKRINGIEEVDAQVTAKFTDGTTDTADFLLGCDGIHSAVRSLYVDPGQKPEYTGICNMFSIVPTASLDSTHLLAQSESLNATLTKNGLFAITPTDPARKLVYWFFSREIQALEFTDHRDGWEERSKKEGNKQVLLDILGDEPSPWVASQREIVEKTESFKFYPIHKLPTGRPWSRGRCLIIGDAAHAMPPHASQGVSMALEDVFLLSELLKSNAQFTEDAITGYVAKRKARTDAMLHAAERKGTVRRQVAPWRLRMNGLLLSGGLWCYKLAGLDRLGLGQRATLYDVKSEVF